MRVTIQDGERVIGHADLTASDPPMCVASGAFYPSTTYARAEHANVVDGEYIGDRSERLSVFSDTYGNIESHVVAIQDYPAIDEIVVDVIGIISPSYDALFGDDPNYRAYWTQSGT